MFVSHTIHPIEGEMLAKQQDDGIPRDLLDKLIAAAEEDYQRLLPHLERVPWRSSSSTAAGAGVRRGRHRGGR